MALKTFVIKSTKEFSVIEPLDFVWSTTLLTTGEDYFEALQLDSFKAKSISLQERQARAKVNLLINNSFYTINWCIKHSNFIFTLEWMGKQCATYIWRGHIWKSSKDFQNDASVRDFARIWFYREFFEHVKVVILWPWTRGWASLFCSCKSVSIRDCHWNWG